MESAMTENGRHLLGIAGMTRDRVEHLLDTSEQFVEVNRRAVKKVPTLRGKTIINLFFEPSTRTRSSFEIAGKRMSADTINISSSQSSVTKGETLIDTALTLQAMHPDIIVVRHPEAGAPHLIARVMKGTSVINAGDGLHEHPTQALLDALTIRQHFGRLDGIKLVLVGDVLRSRVARSNILLHRLFGNEIRVVAPPTLALKEFEQLGAAVYHRMDQALDGADVVMSLRMKFEYLKDYFIPNLDEYTQRYCVRERDLARYAPESVVLSPGPFIRGVEVDSDVIDGPRSRVAQQVENGVAVRMAAMFLLCVGQTTAAAEQIVEQQAAGIVNE